MKHFHLTNTHSIESARILVVTLLFLQSLTVFGQRLAENHLLGKKTISLGTEITYTAAAEIRSVAGQQFVVEKEAQAVFIAGKRIELNPGFKVESGANFIGYIETSNKISIDYLKPEPEKISLTAFPNPSSESIAVCSPYPISSVRIRDMNGFTILEKKKLNSAVLDIDISNLKIGLYILEVSLLDNKVEKIRIERN